MILAILILIKRILRWYKVIPTSDKCIDIKLVTLYERYAEYLKTINSYSIL